MKQPLVSVCIPAYNNAGYIKDTIESILSQTYKNLELVVVDDNSSDNTWEVISSIPDGRLKVFRNEENLGMAGNWNRCMSLTRGEFVKLICADDRIDRDAIEREALAMIKNPSVVLVESDTRLMNTQGKVNGTFRRYPKSGLVDGKKLAKASLMIKDFYGAPVNNLMRRSAFEAAGGFDGSFTYILDFDLWLSMSCLGDVYIIHQPLNTFCVRNDSNTGVMINEKREVYVAEHRRLLEKHARIGKVSLTPRQIERSVRIRRFRNNLVGIYLKVFAK